MNKNEQNDSKKLKYHKYFILGWYGIIATTVFFFFYPINIGLVRLYFLIAIPTIFCGTTVLLWRKKKIRWIPVILLITLSIVFVLPGRKVDRQRLAKRYIDNVRKYQGVSFIWGGENDCGIDCSGLVRKGIINANLQEGFYNMNPSCFRKAFELWWYDCSARALKENYRDWTNSILQANSINQLNHKKLKDGDFAVTMDGIHALLYLGNNEWIEADPGMGKVVLVTVPAKNNCWFDMPVQILRWKQLERK